MTTHLDGLRSIPLTTLDGKPTTLDELGASVILVVNVASKCGFTPQYAALEALYEAHKDAGFTVVGFPCNQFLAQEPGSAEQIATFCSANYGVTFPMMEKIKVNGRNQHPLYKLLTTVPDESGKAGRVGWNFEKFLIDSADNVTRFRSKTTPDDPIVVGALTAALSKPAAG